MKTASPNILSEVMGNSDAELLQSLLNQTSIVATTDLAGKVTSVNDMFCQISGYNREELIGCNHRILNSGFHAKAFFEDMWEKISNGEIWHGEIRNKRKDGTFYWVDSFIAPVKNSSARIQGYISVRHDITERKTAEEALVQSAKMAVLGEMAGKIGHEVLNSIAIIQGSAERISKLLARNPVDLVAIDKFARFIQETTARVVKVVNGLRSISRNADGDSYELVEVGGLIDEVLALCRERLVHHGVALTFSNNEVDLWVAGNRTQLGQVLLNLVSNADDALKDLPEKWLRLDVQAVGGEVKLTITDSGPGIPASVREKLFTPFFTTKEAGKGTGLGLSLARKIVEQHGGKLSLDEESENTRFTIVLPKKTGMNDIVDREILRSLRSLQNETRPRFYSDQIQNFLQSAKEELSEMRSRLAESDFKRVNFLAHRFRTSCGVVGAWGMMTLAEQLKDLASVANHHTCGELLQQLEQLFLETETILEMDLKAVL